MVKEGDMYIDGYLKANLDIAKDVVTKDWDMLFLTDGEEGSGKSVLTLQAAKYCDPTFNADRVCFTPEEFKKAIVNAKKYQSVVFDEAMTGLNSRQAMQYVNVSLVQMLAEIRQKNLFVFIVLPCFFELDKYPAIWRSRALLHVYTKNFERGKFAFFNFNKKKQLYMNGKKFYSYSKPKANFIGSFTNYYPIDEKEYRRKKVEALKSKVAKKSPVDLRKASVTQLQHKNAAFYYLHNDLGMSYSQIARELSKYVSISYRTIGKTINKIETDGFKVRLD